jgi:hypothetical protein
MFSMIDHLSAVLVGAVALMVVLALSIRGRESAVETAVANVSQERAHAVMRILERDIENMRTEAETRDAVGLYTCAVVRDSSGRLQSFTFPTLLDPARGPSSPIGHVTYRVEPVGDSVAVEGRRRPLHRVVRQEDDGTGPVAGGGSGDVLVEVDVMLFANRSTLPASACPDDLSRVRIEFATAVAGPQRHVDGSAPPAAYNLARHGYTFRPPARGR